MKTPYEIKKGLECCTHNNCNECPYRDKRVGCRPYRNDDALALIQQLEEQFVDANKLLKQLEADKQQLEGMLTHMNQLRDAAAGRALKMEERVHQLEAERDAAVEDMHGRCPSCKYYDKDPKEEPCASCSSCYGNMDNWQWRGVQKEE